MSDTLLRLTTTLDDLLHAIEHHFLTTNPTYYDSIDNPGCVNSLLDVVERGLKSRSGSFAAPIRPIPADSPTSSHGVHFRTAASCAGVYTCAMPRTSRALPLAARSVRVSLSGGNGNGTPMAPPNDRLTRIESLLESIEDSLAVQFQRISELQAQLDRAIADRPLPPKR